MKHFQIYLILLLTTFTGIHQAAANEPVPYVIYQSNGKTTSYEKMVKAFKDAQVVFFGELHNNTLNHWLEFQVLKSLYEQDKNIALAMEMLEADNQLIIDEYLNGTIQERHLFKEAKLWDRYKTDYHPMVEFCKEKQLPVIASNIPQRYANLVYRNGLESLDKLSDEGKKVIAPLPIKVDLNLPGYASMMQQMGGHGTASSQGSAANLANAQAVKDATMAHFILKNLQKKIFHVNGAYHSQNYEGIVWYLKQAQPDIRIITIHVVEQDQVDKLSEEHLKSADFIICIPKDMTKSY